MTQWRKSINIYNPPDSISPIQRALSASQHLHSLNVLKFKIKSRCIKTGHIIYIHTYGLGTISCTDPTDIYRSRNFGSIRGDEKVGDVSAQLRQRLNPAVTDLLR